jgi:hypothetical protein
VPAEEWVNFAILRCDSQTTNSNGFELYSFSAKGEFTYGVKSMEEEQVALYPITSIPNLLTLPNLAWQIPFALDSEINNKPIILEDYGK